MSGRGDNNKHSSAGRGASNQSNQPFVTERGPEPASNHNRQPADAHRLEIQVEKVPYILDIERFSFNDELRYHVRYNGSDDILFAFDHTLGRYSAVGDGAGTMPISLEIEIAARLQQGIK